MGGSCVLAAADDNKPWLLTGVGRCQWFAQVIVPKSGDKPKSVQRLRLCLAILKTSINVGIVSSCEWCSSCVAANHYG